MIVRTLVTVVYLVAVVIAVILNFIFPVFSAYLLYGLLGWFILSFFVYRLPVMSRPVFGGAPAPVAASGARAPVGVPLTSNPSGVPLEFCAFCATPVEPGTAVCPSCGHAIPSF